MQVKCGEMEKKIAICREKNDEYGLTFVENRIDTELYE